MLLPPPTPASGPRQEDAPAAGTLLPLVPGLPRRAARRRPLPDATALHLMAVPDSGPPYDDARPGRARRAGSDPGRRARRPGPARLSPPRPATPGSGTWPSQFAQVLAETLAGSRPQGQIAPWTTDQARKRIRQLRPVLCAGPAAGGPAAPRVRRVVTSRPARGVVEMAVIVCCGGRTRALAVRLEQAGPSRRRPGPAAPGSPWICTAIEAA